MLDYYFVPFIFNNPYPLILTVQNQKHVYMTFFDHKDLGNHLLQ